MEPCKRKPKLLELEGGLDGRPEAGRRPLKKVLRIEREGRRKQKREKGSEVGIDVACECGKHSKSLVGPRLASCHVLVLVSVLIELYLQNS